MVNVPTSVGGRGAAVFASQRAGPAAPRATALNPARRGAPTAAPRPPDLCGASPLRGALLGTIVSLVVLLPCLALARELKRPDGLATGVVVEVGDGDTVTVRMKGKNERVRLIGVDTPELHESEKLDRDVARSGKRKSEIQAMGRDARAFTQDRLRGATVWIEEDVEPRDRFGRRLAYLWLGDGTLFNVTLLREGWARVLTIPPNVRYADVFVGAERAARAARRGLWDAEQTRVVAGVDPGSQGSCRSPHPVKGNFTSGSGAACIYHLPDDASYAKTRAERCYANAADARADGCRPARR